MASHDDDVRGCVSPYYSDDESLIRECVGLDDWVDDGLWKLLRKQKRVHHQ